MAPEIIEMTGQQSSACDIWSVGCTVVELITGKPPYFDLQQMPALFRIVQDEHPPLPDNISPVRARARAHCALGHGRERWQALEDFLMQCFQKDPLRRIDAVGLSKHAWLRTAQDHRNKEMSRVGAAAWRGWLAVAQRARTVHVAPRRPGAAPRHVGVQSPAWYARACTRRAVKPGSNVTACACSTRCGGGRCRGAREQR